MDEISNKTLATLLVVAIVISLAGTFFAMRGVTQVTNYVSGFQTTTADPQTGNASVNISQSIIITLVNDTVDFGTGNRNVSDITPTATCNLTSRDEMTGGDTDQCWEYSAGAYDVIDSFLLRNDGNVYVNVTINSSDAATFFNDEPTTGTPYYQWKASDNTSGSYTDWVSTNTEDGDSTTTPEYGCPGTTFGTTWTNFDETNQLMCANMSPYNFEDEFVIDINLGIPAGPSGMYWTEVVFEGEKSEQ